jgi:putative DNA primase/helicase
MATLADPRATFAASGLIGKLLMVDDDFAYGNLLPDGFLKMYSEEKSVTADIKFGDNITFQARALPLILSNHYPHTRDITGAFLERALVLPFSHRITGSDKSDARRAQMFTELPGIANRFVEGLKRLRKRGNWDLPIDCIEASNTWAAHANPAIMFVRDYLNTNLSPQHRIPRARLFQLYRKWDNDQGGGNYRMKKGQFFERMSEILGEPVKSGTWDYVNVSEKKARIDEFDDENDWE